jgi:hypothetical protein
MFDGMSGGKLEGSAGAIFWRAINNGNVIVAESVAREFEKLPLDYALALVRLYGEKNDSRYESAALRYLERLIVEEQPPLTDVAMIASLLAERSAA